MRSLSLRLPPNSDLLQSIELVARQDGGSGFVMGIVGNLSKASFQCPGNANPTVLEGNLEIITLNGTFSPEGVHLHLSLSDSDCQVWGGHLELDTIILKAADVLLGFFDVDHSRFEYCAPPPKKVNPRIEIAVLPQCKWCSKALRILNTLSISYNVITIDSNNSFNEFKKRSHINTFPQIFIDGTLIGGYSQLVELHSTGNLVKFR